MEAIRFMKTLEPEKVAPFRFDGGPIGCLLIHGFMGLPCVMRELGEYLAERGISVLCKPLPGHSTTPEDMMRTTWYDWYNACREDLADLSSLCDSVFLCGLSMGGTLSLHLAAHHAQEYKVAGVVTYGAPVHMKGPLLPLLPIAKKVVSFLKVPEKDVADPAGRDLARSYDRVPLACLSSLLELLAHVKHDLQDVRVPVLLMQSKNDHVVPPSDVHLIHALVSSRDKTVIEVERSYHILPVDYDKRLVKEKTYEFIHRVAHSRGNCASQSVNT
ncbi:MAG: alpha/beta fold hydrolase [Candidatus Abyssobacteria bacterium SURF_17]|jgi:carboxylesterase|uniref:Alpha/beta fold hydrolase n=1 Tax=Candidatus Abyssobacteria bacterium SURF_17 TaxID=2093361 RepID=A0A419ET71_9BACT|nr:MAG: alpha/beta fold hydrolase [Candidatus Abyssubacteria bacterium SURF_17]